MTITLRNIPPDLLRKLEERAKAEGASLAQTVLKALGEGLGARPGKQPVRHHDLDHLAGTWSRKEAAAFDKALKEQRQIDAELWR